MKLKSSIKLSLDKKSKGPNLNMWQVSKIKDNNYLQNQQESVNLSKKVKKSKWLTQIPLEICI